MLNEHHKGHNYDDFVLFTVSPVSSPTNTCKPFRKITGLGIKLCFPESSFSKYIVSWLYMLQFKVINTSICFMHTLIYIHVGNKPGSGHSWSIYSCKL